MRMMLFLFICLFVGSGTLPSVSLGVPCADKVWYARNIWDMTFYDDRLFVGCGNSSNRGPAPNAGPINVWTYRESSGWHSEFTVDEEHIDRFDILDNVLTIPGHDSRDSWNMAIGIRAIPTGTLGEAPEHPRGCPCLRYD